MQFNRSRVALIFLLLGVVYLAGHGMVCAGQHYFSPVDPHEGSFLSDHYCVELMQNKLLEKNPKVLAMYLDMCRT